jgi:DNA-binding response OmpR family regulator
VADALQAVRDRRFDLAVLDVNLGGERVYPVAAALDAMRIPFLFVSGYGEEAIPPGRYDWKVCSKPFRADDLAATMSAVLNSAAGQTRRVEL